jgi:hypothetical protein
MFSSKEMTMIVRSARIMVLGLWVLTLTGCASTPGARYVYQDSEFGVIGIPTNTSIGSTRYRKQAEKLMARHFPKGYEIIRAEEVSQGSRTLTVGNTGSTEVAPQTSSDIFGHVKVARSRTRSDSETLSVTECRIIYRKAGHLPSSRASGGFAADAAMTPTCYVDPNDDARKHAKEPVKFAEEKKAPEIRLAAKSPGGEGL